MNGIAKKAATFGCAAVLAVALAGCSSGGEQSQGAGDQPAQEQKQPLDLTGTWKQVNSNSEDSYQEAVIEGDTITIDWVGDGGDTKSLYWAGSYEAPKDAADSYTWDSVNDKEQTGKAMLASGDDTKKFSYDNGVLSYEASALGTTTTVKLERSQA